MAGNFDLWPDPEWNLYPYITPWLERGKPHAFASLADFYTRHWPTLQLDK